MFFEKRTVCRILKYIVHQEEINIKHLNKQSSLFKILLTSGFGKENQNEIRRHPKIMVRRRTQTLIYEL